MPASTWRTAAGVVGAVVIGGAALVAAATTDRSTDPTASPAATPTASTSPTANTANQPALPTETATPDATSENNISAERAVQIAMSHLPTVGDLVVVEIDLKPEDGRMIWDVEFAGDHEVELDAVTGAMLKLEIGDRDRTDDVGRADDRGGDDDGTDHGDDHGGDDHGGGDDSGHHASNQGSS